MAKRPLEIDMCAGSQLRDTQGETLNVEGADISEMVAGRGRLNDNHGKGFFNCIGKVIAAKKIFKKEDCEDDRQRYYWEKVKSPYVYVKGELFDDEDHPNARAAAAILRNIHKSDCPLKIKASVEGGVVARGIKDPSLLAKTKIHSVALTFVPANQATLVEPLNLDKSADAEADMILIKSVLHLAQTSVPSFRQITRDASATKIEQNVNKIFELMGEEGMELKKALIEESLELKIAENIEKIHELVKNETLNKMAVIHNDPENPVKVWRVQNKGGEGPYGFETDKFIHWTKPHSMADHLKMNPPPRDDLDPEDMAAWTGSPNPTLRESWRIDPNYRFGFEHPDHAKDWFGEQGLKDLARQGFRLAEVPASEVRRSKSGKQVLFKPHQAMNKALMAGYGGAGAPTSLVGGGVMQSESMDRPKTLRYITCDNCGKEQVYGKFQVKCRECNKTFPLAKLEKFFRTRS